MKKFDNDFNEISKADIQRIEQLIGSKLPNDYKIIISGVGKLRNGMVISPQETSFKEATTQVATLFRN